MKFWGKVRTHNKRGEKLGFPTANINLTKKYPSGIYISKTKVGNFWHPSLTFIGTAKTFEEKRFNAETYILDFKKNIYSRWITVEILKKIRVNKKFKNTDELIKQMEKDEKVAKNYFRLN